MTDTPPAPLQRGEILSLIEQCDDTSKVGLEWNISMSRAELKWLCETALLSDRAATKPLAWFRIEKGMRVYYETEAWPNMTPLYAAPVATTPKGTEAAPSSTAAPERVAAALHACEGLDTSDLAGNDKGWLADVVHSAARVESELDRALRACCAGNTEGDEPVRCQSYEASEQAEPCPRGRCVMAEPEEAAAPSATPRIVFDAVAVQLADDVLNHPERIHNATSLTLKLAKELNRIAKIAATDGGTDR